MKRFLRILKFRRRQNSEEISTRSWRASTSSAHSPRLFGPTADQTNQSGRTMILVSFVSFSSISHQPNENICHLANYDKLCNIEVDLTHLPLTPLRGSRGGN